MRILGMAFGKQSAKEKFEEYTVDGRWKIALGLIISKLGLKSTIDKEFIIYSCDF